MQSQVLHSKICWVWCSHSIACMYIGDQVPIAPCITLTLHGLPLHAGCSQWPQCFRCHCKVSQYFQEQIPQHAHLWDESCMVYTIWRMHTCTVLHMYMHDHPWVSKRCLKETIFTCMWSFMFDVVDHSRVILKVPDETGCDYINASYINVSGS